MDDAEGTAAVRPAATVVTFPHEAVFSNAGTVRQRVASALLPGVRAVILDMTPTMFCDTSGLRELVVAHRLGHEQGVEMRVVVPSRLMRMITLTGLQGVLAIYPTLAAALAAGSASALAVLGVLAPGQPYPRVHPRWVRVSSANPAAARKAR